MPARDAVLGEMRDDLLQSRRVARAEAEVTEPGRRMSCELERVTLVITPRAQIHRFAAARGLVQADHRGEEIETGLRPGREQLDVADVSHVTETGKSGGHGCSSSHGGLTGCTAAVDQQVEQCAGSRGTRAVEAPL